MILNIYTSMRAVLFLGTPHRGSSKVDIGDLARRIAAVSGFDTNEKNLRALQIDSTELQMVHESFMHVYQRVDCPFKVLTFQESKGIAGINYLKLNELVSITSNFVH